ncbi:acid phosphatase det1 [Mortierella sp. GBA30]|nr:acid phosphatase det1 [Mortierella sp. GBA30]
MTLDPDTTFTFTPQPRRPKESLLGSLRSRELGVNRGKCHVIPSRRLYRSVYPNATIHGVDCQFSNLKKFTPCGQYLIGMSKNQRSVHIYRFKGSGGPAEERPVESLNFKDFFELKHETVVLRESELLSKDFCLVTANGRFIVDKREFKNEYITIAHHSGVSLYDSLFAVMLIQSQAIQIIHIKNNGKMIDLHRIGWFNHDDDELVLARYRDFNEQYIAQQTISSTSPFYHKGYSIKDEDFGDPRAKDRFDTFALAPTMSSMTEFSADATYHQVPSSSNNNIGVAPRANQLPQSYIAQLAYSQSHHDEPHSQTISGIKQRLMAYLFRKAFNSDDGGAALRHFHLTFQQFANLIMWRMQFLDESTLLIKFGKLDCVIGRPADSTYQTAFFVFYDIHSTQILAVYDNASEEFLRLYEAWADQFCATAYTTAGRDKRHYSSTCSNNIFAKDHLKKTQYGMRHARNGGQRPCQDFPIKFYLRGSGELRFKIHLFQSGSATASNGNSSSMISSNISSNNTNGGVVGTVANTVVNNANNENANNNTITNNTTITAAAGSGAMLRSKRFATFIAHPFEPFIISVVQHHLQPTVLNLHIRIPETGSI